jgi:rhodanese-related sulfurtransferase
VAKPRINEPTDEHRGLSHDEVRRRLQDPALLILNVMPKEVYDDGHIPGSINLPVAEIETKARQLIADLNQEIAVYCAGPT